MTALAMARAGLARRLGLRFLLCYVLLHAFPFPVGLLPGTENIGELGEKLFEPIVLWVGPHVLGITHPISTAFNGSGDHTYHYVLVFTELVIAIAAAVIWSLVDRRGRRDRQMLEWLRLYVRVLVGATMLVYGFAKIFEGQFSTPSGRQLTETYGESSPMRLLWTFMGFSRPYSMFGGFMEAIPGALLFFRRTTAAGALLLLPVMGNVVLLNFCYDVPVKLYSVHLWLLCLFLAAPALPRLVSMLVLNRAVAPVPQPRLLLSRRARIAGSVLYTGLAGALAFQAIALSWPAPARVESSNPWLETGGVRGTFDVEDMTLEGFALEASDPVRWKRVWITRDGIRIDRTDGWTQAYRSARPIDGPAWVDLWPVAETRGTQPAFLDLHRDGGGLILEGRFEGSLVRARLAKSEGADSLLMTRGFHWINEEPFNR